MTAGPTTFFARSAIILFTTLGLGAAACAAPRDTSTEDHAEAAASDAAPWIADGLAVLAARPAFFLTRAPGDRANAKTPGLTATADGLALDFSAFAPSGDAHAARALDRLGALLRLPRPDVRTSIAPGALGDDAFADALGAALEDRRQSLDADGIGARYRSTRAKVLQRTADCAIRPGADCHFFERQAESGMTLTRFELVSLALYTGSEFMNVNPLLRRRPFPAPSADPPVDAESDLDAVDAMFAIGAISALNKLDKTTTRTYRGTKNVHGSCGNGPALAPKATGTAGAVARFCDFFGKTDLYRDCAFSSTSTDPGVALHFDTLGAAKDEGPKVAVVFVIDGKSGAKVATLSNFPRESEVLYKPSASFDVTPGTTQIALEPLDFPEDVAIPFEAFDHVPCGTALTAEQLSRVSHVEVSLVER